MAQGTLWLQPIQRLWTNTGSTSSGLKAYFYLAGTTTAVSVFSDVGLTTAFSQPVVSDVNGIFAEIFLTPGTAYKVDVQTSAGVSLTGYPADNQLAIPASASTVDQTETAGEALTAGQAAYLSDGSGGKIAGQLYKADSTNGYSSTLPTVGMVPSSIASGSAGTFRIAGQVTGLSSLTIGADYYLSTAGTITTSAPMNKRWIGRADTATSIIVNGNFPLFTQLPTLISGGVLTATGTTALTSSGALTASGAVLGGGAGAVPTSTAALTANLFLVGPASGAGAPTARALDPLDMESLFVTATAQFDKTTDTTLADIPGLSITLVAGKTYHLRAFIKCTVDATGGAKIGTAGTATATTFAAASTNITGSSNITFTQVTALGTLISTAPGGTSYGITIEMYIVVNAGGTFKLQFAQAASSATSSLLVGSYLEAK